MTWSASDLKKAGLWLLIPFASLLSHTWLAIPPTLILFLAATVITLILYDKQLRTSKREIERLDKSPFYKTFLIVCGFSLYLFLSQYLIGAPIRRYIGTLVAPLYLALILILSTDIDKKFIEKLVFKFINFSIYILSFEALARLAVSTYKIFNGTNVYYSFYQFKFYSPIYMESNATAIHLITILFFTFWWSRFKGVALKWQKIVLFVLVALTFSRTSIVTVSLGLAFYYFFYKYNWKTVALCTLGILVLMVLGAGLSLNYIEDFSLRSKFQILDEALLYFQTVSLKDFLFGIGFTMSMELMSFYAHNYFLVFLMEAGLIGLILLCFVLFHFIKITNGNALIILLPFIIQTAASTITFTPFLYTAMAIIILFTYSAKPADPLRSVQEKGEYLAS